MNEVDDYILSQSKGIREILIHLHDLLIHRYGLSPKMRYGIPFYDGNKWLCYLNPRQDEKVDLTFLKGKELKGFNGILESRDRKMVKSLLIDSLATIDEKQLEGIMQAALALDRA